MDRETIKRRVTLDRLAYRRTFEFEAENTAHAVACALGARPEDGQELIAIMRDRLHPDLVSATYTRPIAR